MLNVFPFVDDLVSKASAILKSSVYREIREVVAEYQEPSGLRLSGVASSYYFKQLAQETVRRVALEHGTRIHNAILVANAYGLVGDDSDRDYSSAAAFARPCPPARS